MASSASLLDGAPKSTLRFLLQELKPKGKLLTPFNIITLPIILLGLVLTVIRFTQGLGSVTNLNQQFPWGFWIGFDVVCGVAFAAGAWVRIHKACKPILSLSSLTCTINVLLIKRFCEWGP